MKTKEYLNSIDTNLQSIKNKISNTIYIKNPVYINDDNICEIGNCLKFSNDTDKDCNITFNDDETLKISNSNSYTSCILDTSENGTTIIDNNLAINKDVVVSGSLYAPNIYNKEEIDTKLAEIPGGNTNKLVGNYGMFGYTRCDEISQRIVMRKNSNNKDYFTLEHIDNELIDITGIQLGNVVISSEYDINADKTAFVVKCNSSQYNDMLINVEEINCSGNLHAPNIYSKEEIDTKMDNYALTDHTHEQINNPVSFGSTINVSGEAKFSSNIVTSQNILCSGNLNASYINGFVLESKDVQLKTPYFGRIPNIRTEDGVMEVGKYIDFHESSDDTSDFSVRLFSQDRKLLSTGNIVIKNERINHQCELWLDGYGNLFASSTNGTIRNISQNSQTITHETNIIGLATGASSSCAGEIGTFCESNGKIYDGYENIEQTDCICQVVQSTTLNAKIVGIITSKTQFASHGDVLVKIAPGEYEIGDILCPDENGYGKKATESDLMFMMLHAIPRPKITSLNTGIEGTVACFLI